MSTLIALLIIIGCSYAAGWAQGSKDGFRKAVDQLEKIIKYMGARK